MNKIKENLMKFSIYFSAIFTISILVFIIGFVFIKGISGINVQFLTNQWQNKTTYVTIKRSNEITQKNSEGYIAAYGLKIGIDKEKNVYIQSIDKNSVIKKAVDLQNNVYALEEQDVIKKIGDVNITSDMNIHEIVKMFEDAKGADLKIKVMRYGGGIVPMFMSTIYIIILSLAISGPISILSAIYLTEYAKTGRLLNLIRFAVQNLSGIPSIIYGLFGMMVFVGIFKMGYSIMAGALTMSIILLPTIISTTEETLKTIPQTYRSSSLGLGATKLQTIYKIVLPNALPGILVATILSIGRIVGESAALILTAGTVAQIPSALTGSSASGATMTIKLYTLIKEEGNLEIACSIGIVIILLIFCLNMLSKFVTARFVAKNSK